MAERVPFREIVRFALGGGWGEPGPGEGFVPVAVIRGTDFDPAASGRVGGVPRRWESSRKVRRRLLRPGDLLLEISGGSSGSGQSTGRSLHVTPELLDSLGGAAIPASFCRLLRVDEAAVMPRYAAYALRDMYRSGRAARYENQSTGISNFQFEVFLDTEHIRLPDLAEQQAVCSVLGALDDKIAVNDRVAATARRLGLALFGQAVLAAESAGVRVGAVAGTLTRGIAPRYSQSPDALPVVNQRCVRDGWVSLTPARLTHPHSARAPKLLCRDDVLVNSTGVGTLGRVARWTYPAPATADSHITIVRFDAHHVDPVCAGFAMLRAQPEIEAMGEGSTGQTELHRTRLADLTITMPSRARQRHLRPALDALEERAEQALSESHALAALRDALLPRLMSGRLRVEDAGRAAVGHESGYWRGLPERAARQC